MIVLMRATGSRVVGALPLLIGPAPPHLSLGSSLGAAPTFPTSSVVDARAIALEEPVAWSCGMHLHKETSEGDRLVAAG